jgi:lipopolysaccharide export system protein LptA
MGGAASAVALPDDREQPIHITADKAVRDEKRGMTIYSGNVHMRQGSMELEADTLTIFHDAENADQIIARGRPAKMRQRPELEADLVHAHAAVITYFKLEDRVLLERDARVEQKGDLVTGDSIDYLIGQQLITAEADKSAGGEKVFVVLQPTVQPAPSGEPAPGSDAASQDSAQDDSSGASQGQ